MFIHNDLTFIYRVSVFAPSKYNPDIPLRLVDSQYSNSIGATTDIFQRYINDKRYDVYFILLEKHDLSDDKVVLIEERKPKPEPAVPQTMNPRWFTTPGSNIQ